MRKTLSGTVAAAGPGLGAFSPEGERSWVGPAWDPTYPSGDSRLAPGLVFEAAGATWVVVDVERDRVRYARVTPGRRAGTVEVRRLDASTVRVIYDLTALSPDEAAGLEAFADDFDAMLAGWTRSIAATGAR
jgi:hypothetical protein